MKAENSKKQGAGVNSGKPTPPWSVSADQLLADEEFRREQGQQADPERGIIPDLAALPPGSLITETALAGILGKCTASIKSAVDRGELPHPIRLMGKPTWTAGVLIQHIEKLLESEAKKFSRLRI